MSEAELARDLHAALAKVQQGAEIVIEQNHRAVAILKSYNPVGRPISEIIADMRASGSTATIDDEFARDIQAGIDAQREPWNPPSWD